MSNLALLIIAIGSWNFPFLGAIWKIAPGLVSGNAMVFKPSPLAPLVTPVLAEIMTEAGLPDGVLNVIQGHADTGAYICKHPDIAKVSFTGGIETGKKVISHQLFRCVLNCELALKHIAFHFVY